MSYDFRIVEKDTVWGVTEQTCSCGRHHGTALVDLGDPTYNVGDIFRKATSGRFKQGEPIPAPEALAMWTAALADMEAKPDEYRPLEPENGWGSLESAKRNARRCIDALSRLDRIGFLEVDLWEPVLVDQYATEREKAARPKRRIQFADLVFIA